MTMPDTIYAWPSELHTLTGQWSQTRYPDEAVKFIRADIHSAEIERLTTERDAALTGAVNVKPLKWFKVDTVLHVGEWVAETPGGALRIIQTKSPACRRWEAAP